MKKSSFVLLILLSGFCFADDFKPKEATLEELFFHMRRPTIAAEKRALKSAAQKEFYARKGDALRFLMSHIEVRNIWLRVHA